MKDCNCPLFEKQALNVLQTYPLANIFHIIIGMLIYHYNYLVLVLMVYTLTKLLCFTKESIVTRLPSLIEMLIGYLISFYANNKV